VALSFGRDHPFSGWLISFCIPSIRGASRVDVLNADLVLALCSFAATKIGIASRCGGSYFDKANVLILVSSLHADLCILTDPREFRGGPGAAT
jgi:hypothetical protein